MKRVQSVDFNQKFTCEETNVDQYKLWKFTPAFSDNRVEHILNQLYCSTQIFNCISCPKMGIKK